MSDYTHPPEWYDRLYGAMKDYAAEADVVDGIVRARVPGASSLLDVGCGTGLHLQRFAELYDHAEGVDLDPSFVAAARARGLRVTVGDMRDFSLGRTFDAVTCLFSAIGHVGGVDDLRAAVASLAAHVAPGGVLVIEPWYSDEAWQDGHYGVEVNEGPDSTLVRVNHSVSDGRVSVVHFAWTEASHRGIRHIDEQMRLTRFTGAEFAAAFEAAGLDATFDPAGLNTNGRGLWICLRRS
jgi:SAM-dependent methyltransferase